MKILMMSRRIKNFLEKGGECKSCKLWWCREEITCLSSSKRGRMWMYVYMILMMSKEESNKAHFASRLIQDCFNKQSLDSRFLQDQALPHNERFQVIQGTCNRLPMVWKCAIDYTSYVIDYQRLWTLGIQILNEGSQLFKKNNCVIDYTNSVIDY